MLAEADIICDPYVSTWVNEWVVSRGGYVRQPHGLVSKTQLHLAMLDFSPFYSTRLAEGCRLCFRGTMVNAAIPLG